MTVISRVVASIPRPTTGEEIKVSLMRSGDRRFVDLRVYSATHNSQGEPLPTKAGLSIRVDQVDNLIAALRAAEAAR